MHSSVSFCIKSITNKKETFAKAKGKEENVFLKKQEKQQKEKAKTSMKHKVLTIVGIALCVILLPILILNCILIVKSWTNKDEIPNIGGLTPLIVLTDSMDPKIKSGDVIVCKEIDGEDVRVDYVIAFFDPASKTDSVVTHRVTDVKEIDGVLYFQTKGDNNNDYDRVWVSEEDIVGVWEGFRLPLVGHVALFMQTTWGLLVCILVPLSAFIVYDVIRRRKTEQTKQEDVEALKRELEALKASKEAESTSSESKN